MTRRDFLGFFFLGGFLGLLARKVKAGERPKKAMFWRKAR